MSIAPPGTAPAPAAVQQALTGQHGITALREIARRPWAHGLTAALEGSEAGARPESLRLLRTKFKPGRSLWAYYRLGWTGESRPRDVAVRWRLGATESRADIEALICPADPAMPQLARLVEPGHLADLIRDLPAGPADAAALNVSMVRYRPGQRHVLRVFVGGDTGSGLVLKTDRDSSGAHAVAVAAHVADLLAELAPTADVVRPLGYSVSDRTALWQHAPGRLLSGLVARGGPDAAACAAHLGQAMRVLHAQPAAAAARALGGVLPAHDIGAEAAAVLRAGEHIRVLLPSLGRVFDDVVAEVRSRVESAGTEDARLLHGDLKADNVLVVRDRVRILDLDRCSTGDPALDLAKLVADLRWWTPGPARAAERVTAAFRSGYGGEPQRWARARMLAPLFELKFAARRCAVHDPQWARKVHAQVAAASAAMSGRRSA